MEYTDKKDKKIIKFEERKYHFLLATSGLACHIKFDVPKFLIKNPTFGN